MGSEWGDRNRLRHAARLAGATAMAAVMVLVAQPSPGAFAQEMPGFRQASPNAQMLLEADRLVYNNDRETVVAAGAVQIEYDGYRLVARDVTYDRRSGRLIARGNVEIVDRDGNKIFSDEIDITEDFADGFLSALRIETADKTYFGAESAERRDGRVTTFNSGVYTACEPCEDKPGKPPIWRIKARTIIWDGEEKTVSFRHARFELFGLPIMYLPYFKMADPTVKRKSGFLFPGIHYKSELGWGGSIPYYLALSPSHDLLLMGTYYQRQGFLGQAEWRQQFDNGQYNIRIAGIRQANPTAFRVDTVDRAVTSRGMIATQGAFKINPRWTFGWNVLIQSDKNFARTYEIEGYKGLSHRSEIYLTGLNDRNYFDLRAMRFRIQEETTSLTASRDPQQPWVLPKFEYSKTFDAPVAGGELSFGIDAQSLYRNTSDISPARPAVRGIAGENGRITAEVEWKRQIIAPGGLVVTPLLHARADGIYSNPDAASAAAIGAMAGNLAGTAYTHDGTAYGAVNADLRSSYFRPMATAGLELRWPILFTAGGAAHVFEPIAQLFVRPDDSFAGRIGIPNEDAQSLVFDAASLFERDKFSGYDRVEGGTRANVGFRYSGSFANGWTANAIFGQSYHLAGTNPYASPDLVNVGAFSGLETDVSDFVGLVGLTSPGGLSVAAGGRFDERTFEVRRAEVRAAVNTPGATLSAGFAFIQAQPLYGFADDRKELTVAANTRLNENWRLFGSGTYDFESNTLVRNSLGFSYDDECFTYEMSYSEIRPTGIGQEVTTNIGFKLAFRTLGDVGASTNQLDTF